MAGASIRRQSRARNAQRAQVRRDAAAAKKQEWLDNTVQTRRGRRRVNNSTTSSTGTTAAAATAGAAGAVAGAAATAAATTAAPASSDGVQLSSAAQQANTNPFEGFASGSSSVKVKGGDNLEALLTKQGYSTSEIYGDNGALAQVMKANPGIKDANLIYPDQNIKLPVRAEETSEAAPAKSTVPLQEQTEAQLHETAQTSRAQAMENMTGLTDTIGTLGAEDQKAIGQSMFYETASASGLYQTQDGGESRNMSAAEVRNYYSANLEGDAKSQAQDQVRGWLAENPIEGQNAMAQGAAGWAYDNYDQNAPLGRQQQMLSIAQNSNGVMENNNNATNAAYELFGRDADAGRQLFSTLNN